MNSYVSRKQAWLVSRLKLQTSFDIWFVFHLCDVTYLQSLAVQCPFPNHCKLEWFSETDDLQGESSILMLS